MKDQLAQIKTLFISGHHKKCATKCEELLCLDNRRYALSSVDECYLNFYAGLSYEALARNMCFNSSVRQQNLRQAEGYYVSAETSLPSTIVTRSMSPSEESDWSDEPDERAQTPTPTAPFSQRTSYAASRDSWVSSEFTNDSEAEDDYYLLDQFPVPKSSADDLRELMSTPSFSPLVYNPTPVPAAPAEPTTPQYDDILSSLQAQCDNSRQLLSSLSRASSQFPPIIVEADESSRTAAQDHESSTLYSPTASAHFHTMRFNSHLHDFSQMLQMHIANVRGLQHPTITTSFRVSANKSNTTNKRLSTFTDAMSRKAKIAELVERAWRRERFQPERYRDLCEHALEEI